MNGLVKEGVFGRRGIVRHVDPAGTVTTEAGNEQRSAARGD